MVWKVLDLVHIPLWHNTVIAIRSPNPIDRVFKLAEIFSVLFRKRSLEIRLFISFLKNVFCITDPEGMGFLAILAYERYLA